MIKLTSKFKGVLHCDLATKGTSVEIGPFESVEIEETEMTPYIDKLVNIGYLEKRVVKTPKKSKKEDK